jgi:hypothetical protein
MSSEDKVVCPTQEWIAEAKKTHGRVFKAVLSGETFIYRTLKRSEYNALNQEFQPQVTQQGPMLTPEQSRAMEEKICSLCTIWPVDYSKLEISAGVPTMLASLISDASGYRVEEEPTEL